jgi:hypothetical protein
VLGCARANGAPSAPSTTQASARFTSPIFILYFARLFFSSSAGDAFHVPLTASGLSHTLLDLVHAISRSDDDSLIDNPCVLGGTRFAAVTNAWIFWLEGAICTKWRQEGVLGLMVLVWSQAKAASR